MISITTVHNLINVQYLSHSPTVGGVIFQSFLPFQSSVSKSYFVVKYYRINCDFVYLLFVKLDTLSSAQLLWIQNWRSRIGIIMITIIAVHSSIHLRQSSLRHKDTQAGRVREVLEE